MNQAIFCLSIDTELLWGRHDKNYHHFIQSSNNERTLIHNLLQLFQKLHIHGTWAIVGHLFLEKCDGKHSELTLPVYPWIKNWLAPDPASNLQQDPLWYAPDIVKQIKQTPGQEIASHSFTHLIFDHPACTPKVAQSDLNACQSAARKLDIKLTSFVFPRNKIGHLDLLSAQGFQSFRGPNPEERNAPGLIKKLIMGLDLFLLLPHTTTPQKTNDLTNIRGTYYFLSYRGWRKYVPSWVRILKAKRGINQAITKKEIFHLWFHPIDLIDSQQKAIQALQTILEYIDQKQQQGLITSLTMQEITKQYQHSFK